MNTRKTQFVARVKLLSLIVGLSTISTFCASAGAAEAKSQWSGFTEVGYFSDYLWRGQKLASDSIQPAISATYAGNLQLGMWGNYGLRKGPNGNYSETDFLGSYTLSQDKFSLSVGGTLYRIDDLVDSATGKSFKYYFESLVTVAFKVRFNPTLTYYREYGRLDTNYVEGSVSESVALNKDCRLSFRPFGGAFENSKHYYGAEISLNVDLGQSLYGRATLNLVKNNYPGVRHENTNVGVVTGYRW